MMAQDWLCIYQVNRLNRICREFSHPRITGPRGKRLRREMRHLLYDMPACTYGHTSVDLSLVHTLSVCVVCVNIETHTATEDLDISVTQFNQQQQQQQQVRLDILLHIFIKYICIYKYVLHIMN